MTDGLVAGLRQTIATHRLLKRGARVVVAVSGGADSVALLHLLRRVQPEWRLTLHVAHLDHGLRDASADDAAFVQQLAEQWHLPATIQRAQVSSRCKEAGWSLEEGARRIRYQFLLDVAQHQSASHLASAHTADDQAETVLMRIVRGTGLLGLGAIPMKRQAEEVWLIRPLLEVWRREILAYLAHHRLAYREDATNTDTRFVRNRIRHELLPLLERDYNPSVKGALTQLAEQSRLDYAYLQDAASRLWKRAAKVRPPGEVRIIIRTFLRQPKALQRQLVREAIQRVRGDLRQFEFRHWLEVERLFGSCPHEAVVDLPGGVQFARRHEQVICRRAVPPPLRSPQQQEYTTPLASKDSP